MQTPVPEAVLCFLCLHRLGQQQIKTWVKSGPCNIHTVIWIFCVAQTSTDCNRSLNTLHMEMCSDIRSAPSPLCCQVVCISLARSTCWVWKWVQGMLQYKKKIIGPASVRQGRVILFWAYSTVNSDGASIFQTDPATALLCPAIELGSWWALGWSKGNHNSLP